MTTAFILCIVLEVALLGLAAYISFGDTVNPTSVPFEL